MTIKEFVENYENRATESLKDDYIKETLEVTKYIPFVKKETLARNLVDISTYEYENYEDEDGVIKRRKTDKIKVNSTVQYLLFCRIVIENYTNLKVETDGFFEEYDVLKASGLLDKLMGENAILPMDDIAEFRTIVDMKQKDVLFNETTTQAFISKQIERISNIANVMLPPIVNRVTEKLDRIPEDKLNELIDLAKNGMLKEV